MTKAVRMTLRDVSSAPKEQMETAFGQFLDDFARAGEGKAALISDRPVPTGDEVFDAKLAASAELLAHRNSLEVPGWSEGREYFLESPAWGMPRVCARSTEAKDYLRSTTCDEFRRRNLMYGDGVLARC